MIIITEEKLEEVVTKACQKSFDKSFDKIFDAGYNTRTLEEKEDNNRQLTEMYRFGVEKGREEAFTELGAIDLEEIDA